MKNGVRVRFYLDGIEADLVRSASVDGFCYSLLNTIITYNSRSDVIHTRALDIKITKQTVVCQFFPN